MIKLLSKLIMKALLFSCACILGASFWGVSQNIEIKLDGGGADISGSSYDVNVTEATLAQNGGIFTAHFVVTNNTENNGKWQIMRKKITVPSTWEDQVCWPPTCYNASGDIYYTPSSTDYVPTIIAGSDTTSNGQLAEIKVNVNIGSNYGQGTYRYYIVDYFSLALVDSVDLSISFTLGVNSLKKNESSISVGPNPADNVISIVASNNENSTLRIVDALGNIVHTEEGFNGSKKMDVSNFKTGVYFVIIENEGITPVTRKLIIKH
jgi:hypothetical protein